jgi:carboxymethylenebutenolidase
MGSMIEFARPDGGRTKGYLADAGKKRPGIVVIQEWWGLNDQIKSVADRFAKAGITALAPDLFKGKVTTKSDEASHLMNNLDFPDATHQDLRGAVKHLKSSCPKVAVTGFCMGGALAIAAGVHIPEIDAAICLYGIPPKKFADPAKIQVPFQGHFATKDDWITPAKVRELEDSLKKSGVEYEIYSYNADHAFCNDRRPEVYDPAAAKLVWDRSLKFLAAKL